MRINRFNSQTDVYVSIYCKPYYPDNDQMCGIIYIKKPLHPSGLAPFTVIKLQYRINP